MNPDLVTYIFGFVAGFAACGIGAYILHGKD